MVGFDGKKIACIENADNAKQLLVTRLPALHQGRPTKQLRMGRDVRSDALETRQAFFIAHAFVETILQWIKKKCYAASFGLSFFYET